MCAGVLKSVWSIAKGTLTTAVNIVVNPSKVADQIKQFAAHHIHIDRFLVADQERLFNNECGNDYYPFKPDVCVFNFALDWWFIFLNPNSLGSQ